MFEVSGKFVSFLWISENDNAHKGNSIRWNALVCLFPHCYYLRSFVSAVLQWEKWVTAVITSALHPLSHWQKRNHCQSLFSIVSIRTTFRWKYYRPWIDIVPKVALSGNVRWNFIKRTCFFGLDITASKDTLFYYFTFKTKLVLRTTFDYWHFAQHLCICLYK